MTETTRYPGSYYAASATPAPPRPALEGTITPEVAVVGAGFTGLSAALTLAELAEDFGMDEDAAGMVVSLLDQIHGLRRRLRGLAVALADEPDVAAALAAAAVPEAQWPGYLAALQGLARVRVVLVFRAAIGHRRPPCSIAAQFIARHGAAHRPIGQVAGPSRPPARAVR